MQAGGDQAVRGDDKAGADPDETTNMDVILAEQWVDFLIIKLNG